MSMTVNRAQVQQLLDDGAIAVEALPPDYHARGHLPGALNLPLDGLDRAAELLPDRDQHIVVYCADEPCPNSTIVAQQLTSLGYRNVHDYTAGKQDWSEAGLPLEATEVTS